MASSRLGKEWWEDFVSFLIQFWWVILLVIAIGLTLYFLRDWWMPLLGLM
jgi:fatty acid desaturase